jgi:hypothetical protein
MYLILKGGPTTGAITDRYLRQLPPELFQQLLKLYQTDLDLFGYKPPAL